MENISRAIIFKIFDRTSPDEQVANELAILSHELYEEINYPHPTVSIAHYRLRLSSSNNHDEKRIFILIQFASEESIGFCELNIHIGKVNRQVCNVFFYIKPIFRQKGYFGIIFLESLKYIPDYVSLYSFFFRIDENQLFPKEMISLDKKLSSLADRLDCKMVYVNRRSEVDLTRQSLDKVSQKAKEFELKANKNGYSIFFVDDLSFKNVTFTRAQYVKLLEELDNSMPREAASLEDITLTEEDFVNRHKSDKKDGVTEWIYIAVDNRTNLPIAMTETRLKAELPSIATVGDTGVKQEHRGKRLGLTLKYVMLQRLLTDPLTKNKVKTWMTWNAQSNIHMIAINDELGYVESFLQHQYEVSIDKLKEYLAK